MLSNYSNRKNDTIKVITESIDFVRKGIIKLCKYLLQKKKRKNGECILLCVKVTLFVIFASKSASSFCSDNIID